MNEEVREHILESEAGDEGAPRVSIYLPKQTPGFGLAHRKFRLVRMIKEAERLIAKNHGVMQARAMISRLWRSSPLEPLEQSGSAMALFHDREFTGIIPIPEDVPERVVVAESFHIKPLLQWLQAAKNYYVVSLSSQGVRLYEGSPWELRLIRAVHAEPEFRDEGGRSDRRPKGGHQMENRRERIRRFFLKAEESLDSVLRSNHYPVVIAGVGYLHSIYREVSRDPDVAIYSIRGNVEKWTLPQLRGGAIAVLAKLMGDSKKRAVEEYHRHTWSGEATDDLAIVARAAIRGQVRKVMVASDRNIWGKIDRVTGELTLHTRQEDSIDDDILDDIAEAVLASGGKVMCMSSSELPGSSPVPALLGA